MSETVLTILACVAAFLGLAVSGFVCWVICRWVEQRREKKNRIVYLYSEHYRVKGGNHDGYFHF